MDTEVVHDEARSRYEVLVDGAVGAHADYHRSGDTVTFTHTTTRPALRGNGLAAVAVKRALDDALAANLHVVPQCWYVAEYIQNHPEYAGLL
jgi:predicted GNAT family acetyltransferase